jgi:protein-disulfide isomerase
MNRHLGPAIVLAALILGGAVLAGTWKIGRAVDDAAEQVAAFRTAVSDLKDAVKQAAQQPAGGAQRPSGPDPNRRYDVDLTGVPLRGNAKAKVTVVEWSDFQCPFCAKVGPTMKQLEAEYGDRVRFAFKHLPLSFHPKAPAAHAAAEAAHRQGKFWEMHDRIFEKQQEMAPEKYVEWARELGLDVAKFQQDAAAAEVKSRIDADVKQAGGLGVTGTPSFFVNGRFLQGAKPFEAFKEVIEEELKRTP